MCFVIETHAVLDSRRIGKQPDLKSGAGNTVVGSRPTLSVFHTDLAQLGERLPYKQGVVSSSLTVGITWPYGVMVSIPDCLSEDVGSIPTMVVCNVLEKGNSIPPADFLLDNWFVVMR